MLQKSARLQQIRKLLPHFCRHINKETFLQKRQVNLMLSIAVCDDEALQCCTLSNKIREILEQRNLSCTIRQFYNGNALLQEAGHFDILFLDILMQGLDGLETARRFRRQASDQILIFISSSRDYVWNAYDVEAFHYLLKPIDDRKLAAVLLRAVQKTRKHPREYLVIRRERQQKKVFLDNIRYFEIRGRMIEVHETADRFAYYEQIRVLEDRLQGKGFFRCHKSFLVNLNYVDSYNRQELLLDNGERIPIAKRRYDDFCAELLACMRKNGGIL